MVGGGVLKWCQQLAARSEPHGWNVEDDPTLSVFNGIILHIDADVATFHYSNLGSTYTNNQAAALGLRPLPCATQCPPKSVASDDLFNVLQSWLKPATLGAKTVVCIPAMNTGSWQAAATLPTNHQLLVHLECCAGIEAHLQTLPLNVRIDKKKRASRLKAAEAVEKKWSNVTTLCSRAHEFDQAIRFAFP